MNALRVISKWDVSKWDRAHHWMAESIVAIDGQNVRTLNHSIEANCCKYYIFAS